MAPPILVEDVNDDIGVVQQRPLATAQSLLGPRRLIVPLFCELLYAAGNGFDLRIGLPFANDESRRHTVWKRGKINDADGLSLDLLYAFDDARDECIG